MHCIRELALESTTALRWRQWRSVITQQNVTHVMYFANRSLNLKLFPLPDVGRWWGVSGAFFYPPHTPPDFLECVGARSSFL